MKILLGTFYYVKIISECIVHERLLLRIVAEMDIKLL